LSVELELDLNVRRLQFRVDTQSKLKIENRLVIRSRLEINNNYFLPLIGQKYSISISIEDKCSFMNVPSSAFIIMNFIERSQLGRCELQA